MRRGIAVTVLALSLAVFSAGCPKGLAGVATASDTISHALKDAQDGVKLAVANNQMSAAEDTEIEGYFVQVSRTGQDLDAAIKNGSGAATISAKVNVFLDAFNKLNTDGLAGIKNPQTKLAVSTALNGAEAAVAIIQSQLGAK